MTRPAPSRPAIWPAIEPTDPAPPETNTVSPGRTGDQAQRRVGGRAGGEVGDRAGQAVGRLAGSRVDRRVLAPAERVQDELARLEAAVRLDPAEVATARAEPDRAVAALGPAGSPAREIWRLVYVEDRPVAEVTAGLGFLFMALMEPRLHRPAGLRGTSPRLHHS